MGKPCTVSGPLPGTWGLPARVIYVAWSGHSKTGRVQAVLMKRTAAKVKDDKMWERAMQ